MRPMLRKLASLQLACGLYPLIGYVVSEDNPADAPSRRSVVKRRDSRYGKPLLK